jgi:hypothetical protein
MTNTSAVTFAKFGIRAPCLIAVVLMLAGCATHTWVPGPDVRGTFGEADGRCKLLANNTGGGFYAQGSQQFVAGAALGAAIGQAVKAQNNYNACMEANGWEIADEGRPPTPASYAPPASYTSPPSNVSATPSAATYSYSGETINGKKEGHGTATYADGSKYVGDFKNDVRSGQGVWTDTRGDRYDGQWANDRRNGFGMYTDVKDGDSRGIWQDGELVKRQTAQPVPATVTATAASSIDVASPTPPRSTSVTVSSPGPAKAVHPKSISASASSAARPAKSTRPTNISATAAALSTNGPAKSTSLKPVLAKTSTVSTGSSTLSTASCTHEEQVEARIAKENGYTGGPKCD